MKRQNFPVLGIFALSLTEERCGSKKTESDDGWATGMENYCLYWNRCDGSLYVLKSRSLCNDLGGSMSSALSGLYIQASLLLKISGFLFCLNEAEEVQSHFSAVDMGMVCWND